MAASITGILDQIVDRMQMTGFATEQEYRDIKADIAEVRENFPVDIQALVRDTLAESGT